MGEFFKKWHEWHLWHEWHDIIIIKEVYINASQSFLFALLLKDRRASSSILGLEGSVVSHVQT